MKNNPLKLKITGDENHGSMKIHKESSSKTVYDIDFEKIGNGRMVCYEPFYGIQLTFIEVHAFKFDEFDREGQNKEIAINHCRKGRFECYFNGKYQYMEEGDLVAVTDSARDQYSGFPLGFYEGIEIFIDIEKAKDSLSDILGYSFDLNELYEKIADNNNFLLIKATKEIEHIFDEMYNVDEKIKETYFKLKLLELFLFLKITPLNNKTENRPQISKKHVEIVKKIKNELVENIDKPLTLKLLSDKHGISITSLKSYFKIIYGKPLFTWRKEYRLQVAKKLLKENRLTIGKIANMVGYKNSSKFSAAFKKYYHISPSQYRFQNK